MLSRIIYSDLNSRQKENYNYQKIAGILADYGFLTHRLSDDWNGADFIAQHLDGIRFLKVQLKGRLCFYKKYLGQDLWIAFPTLGGWYLYPHDKVLELIAEQTNFLNSDSWMVDGAYSWPGLSIMAATILAPFHIAI